MKMLKVLTLSLLIFHIFALPALAIDLSIPVACSYGKDCFIESYFDHIEDDEKFTDYTCGDLSRDGHSSTDFKLKSFTEMKDGVQVVASDTGTVEAVRDGMTDISIALIGEEAVRGKECGNAVIITHKRGYTTVYCHLMEKSITVAAGDKVEKGQKIGLVGMSGLSSFPFLEFIVLKEGVPIDPFTGEDPVTGGSHVACGSLDIYPLWDKQTEKMLKYVSTALLSTGFAARVPHAHGAREGKFSKTVINSTSRFLVFWADVFGVIKGDYITMSITDPSGTVIAEESREFTASRIQHFQFVGKKPDGKEWSIGEYTGKIELLRGPKEDQSIIISQTDKLEVKKLDELKKKRKSKGNARSSESKKEKRNIRR